MSETTARTGSHSARPKSEHERKSGDFTEQATAQLAKVATHVEDAAKATVERGREMGEQVHAVGKNARSALDRSLKDQPMTTVAIAVVMGFLLGAVWKS